MVKKSKTRFICQNCGYVSYKWQGRCPECGEWGSFQEEIVKKDDFLLRGFTSKESKPLPIPEIKEHKQKRYSTGIEEFDRILGGGGVPGSLILIGGEPGVGKSTLLMEVGNKLSSLNCSVLYISGEESAEQSKLRASRLKINSPYLYILTETNLNQITLQIMNLKPKIVIIDSIQTLYREDYSSAPGSVSQLRECTAYLMRLAKSERITVFLIGHVTKEGAIAGPRVLEHIVDTVLYFESGKDYQYRILRVVKNRFGPCSEIGIFNMEKDGLKGIANPSKLFLENTSIEAPGVTVVSTIEGTRSFLVEIQALVSPSNLAIPRRITQGVDYNRLCLLLAVLEKRGKLRLYDQDVYINIAGGVRVREPACDLGIALAITSSYKDKAFPKNTIALGEIGLSGDIRPLGAVDKRIKEAVKLGFTQCFISKSSLKKIKTSVKMKFIGVKDIREAMELFEM